MGVFSSRIYDLASAFLRGSRLDSEIEIQPIATVSAQDLLLLPSPSPEVVTSLTPFLMPHADTQFSDFDALTERVVVIVDGDQPLSETSTLELKESVEGQDTRVFLDGALVAVLNGMSGLSPDNLVLTMERKH
ncbi:MAG: hypothetical protein ABJO27_09670 [Pseudoruegeria sp.]